MPPKTIYCGRFISAPTPGPDSALEIREGAVLVGVEPSLASSRDQGGGVEEARIEKVDWTVSSAEEARRVFGFADQEGDGVEVVCCKREGFFFPGFVGEFIRGPFLWCCCEPFLFKS